MCYNREQLQNARAERDRMKAVVAELRNDVAAEQDPFYKKELQKELDEAITYCKSCEDYVDDIIIDMHQPEPL